MRIVLFPLSTKRLPFKAPEVLDILQVVQNTPETSNIVYKRQREHGLGVRHPIRVMGTFSFIEESCLGLYLSEDSDRVEKPRGKYSLGGTYF